MTFFKQTFNDDVWRIGVGPVGLLTTGFCFICKRCGIVLAKPSVPTSDGRDQERTSLNHLAKGSNFWAAGFRARESLVFFFLFARLMYCKSTLNVLLFIIHVYFYSCTFLLLGRYRANHFPVTAGARRESFAAGRRGTRWTAIRAQHRNRRRPRSHVRHIEANSIIRVHNAVPKLPVLERPAAGDDNGRGIKKPDTRTPPPSPQCCIPLPR